MELLSIVEPAWMVVAEYKKTPDRSDQGRFAERGKYNAVTGSYSLF